MPRSNVSRNLVIPFAMTASVMMLNGFSLLTAPKAAQAAEYCQCVKYVENVFGIRITAYSAKDSGGSLQNQGFRQVSNPQSGAIVVMQPSFPGADRTHGHIGVISSVSGDGKISVKGANQSGNRWTEAGCNDVSQIGFATSVNGRNDISFWVRGGGGSAPSNSSGNVRQSSFSAWVMSTNGITLRNSPKLGDRANRTVNYRQTIAFDAWTYGETVNDLETGRPDARWYKMQGTNYWIPSAYVNGNAPGSNPLP